MSRRAVFLDRDGVINRAVLRHGKPHPPASLAQLEIIPGVPEALAALRAAGFRLVVVTNQPDVGRGLTPVATIEAIHRHMLDTLPLDAISACLHGGDDDCSCRKPKPGLILEAARTHDIALAASFMVGDRWRDMDAGAAAGCRTIFIDEGYDERAPLKPPDFTCRTLAEAASWILTQGDGT